MKSVSRRFHFLIRDGDALVLAEVFGPTFNDEGLEIASGRDGIFVEAPANRAVAPTNSAQSLHGARELLATARIDQVFDSNQDRAVFGMDARKRRGLRPMIRRRGVDSGKSGELQTTCGRSGRKQRDSRDSEGSAES